MLNYRFSLQNFTIFLNFLKAGQLYSYKDTARKSLVFTGPKRPVRAAPHHPDYPDLDNLIANAMTFHKGEQPIEVELKREKGFAVITVADRGKGLPEGKEEKIFKDSIQNAQLKKGSAAFRSGLVYCQADCQCPWRQPDSGKPA